MSAERCGLVLEDRESHASNVFQWPAPFSLEILSAMVLVAPGMCSSETPSRLHSSVGRASHQYRGGHGFKSRLSFRFFSGLSL